MRVFELLRFSITVPDCTGAKHDGNEPSPSPRGKHCRFNQAGGYEVWADRWGIDVMGSEVTGKYIRAGA